MEKEIREEPKVNGSSVMELKALQLQVEGGSGYHDENLDDDGRPKRTGTVLTASAHIITAVIGSGVLSLAWAIAQLGWIAGPLAIMVFSLITAFCSNLLADCYRSPDPVNGKRNYTYKDAVRANLGGMKYKLCAVAQHTNLIGTTIGYTITTAISMGALKRSDCYHKMGHSAVCKASDKINIIIFGGIQLILSQIPNFHKLGWLSIVAAVMSIVYSMIGLGLSIAKIIEGGNIRTSLTGVTVGIDVTSGEKIWRAFQAMGNIAFAYTFSNVLIEIQDTLKSSPPEHKVMRKASCIGVSSTTIFYMSCGILGYAAFGNNAPGNFLTGFGFYEPFWLIDIGNICIAIHLIGAYQVMAQPIFQSVEGWCHCRWPDSAFVNTDHPISIPLLGEYPFNIFRFVWRTIFVAMSALVAMVFPFFNDILGLIGAVSYWPLSVYFPVEMYMAQRKIRRFSTTWMWLKILSSICLIVGVLAACGSLQGLIHSLRGYKSFKSS